MNFDTLLKTISPRLKRMAKNHNGHGLFIDEEDLYQEMCIHLWNSFPDGMPPGINVAYIAKGCEFHILNYLRKVREKAKIVSLEKPINEYGDTLRDLVPDEREPLDRFMDRNLSIEDMKNNNFTVREKEILSLLLKGLTVREMGEKLGISHVMVVKVKKRIIKRWMEKKRVTKPPKFLLTIVEVKDKNS